MVLEISPYLSTNWVEVASYQAATLTHTLTTAVDSIVAYTEYRFRYKSVNAFGSSIYSPELAVAALPLPEAPEPVTKVQELSSKTSLTIAWAAPLTDPETVFGTQLFMQDYATGLKTMVYNGERNPNTFQYTV